LYNTRAVLQLLPIIEVLASFVGTKVNVDVATHNNQYQQRVNTASTEGQQSVNRGSTERQPSVSNASTIWGVASRMIQGLNYGVYP
jgi:hypothetical protein